MPTLLWVRTLVLRRALQQRRRHVARHLARLAPAPPRRARRPASAPPPASGRGGGRYRRRATDRRRSAGRLNSFISTASISAGSGGASSTTGARRRRDSRSGVATPQRSGAAVAVISIGTPRAAARLSRWKNAASPAPAAVGVVERQRRRPAPPLVGSSSASSAPAEPPRARRRGEDRGEVALAGARRPDEQHQRRRPARPGCRSAPAPPRSTGWRENPRAQNSARAAAPDGNWRCALTRRPSLRPR